MRNKLTDWLKNLTHIDPNYGVTHAVITLLIMVAAMMIDSFLVTIVGVGSVIYWISRELKGPDQYLPWYKRLVAYPDRFLDWFLPTLVVIIILVAEYVK